MASAQLYSVIETVAGDFYLGFDIVLRYEPDETLDYDFDSGNTESITTTIRSKTFVTGTPTQGFRLRKLYSNFQRGSGSVTQTLTDPQSGDSKAKTASGSGWVDSKEITDSFAGDLETTHKLYYQISGDLIEFNGMELEGMLRHRRRTWS